MLNITASARDGLTRRTLLRAGVASLASLNVAGRARVRASGKDETAVIFLFLGGGLSHVDTYDMKPQAAAEVRGEFKPCRTNVVGIQICELLSQQAQRMDKVALVRTVAHNQASHGIASHFLLTGHPLPRATPDAEVSHLNPSIGSVIAERRGSNRPHLPPFVLMPYTTYQLYHPGAAYLGGKYHPFCPGTQSDPTTVPSNPRFRAPALELSAGVDTERLGDRRRLMRLFDGLKRGVEAESRQGDLDRYYAEAFEILSSDVCRRAFDLHQEGERVRDRYGRHTLGQTLLLARRLVEAGTTFVLVNGAAEAQWDTHFNNFPVLRRQLPRLDQALSALIDDIYARGLDRKVLVVAFGEFGRTPRINKGGGFGAPGRDHWPQTMSVLFSGGGLNVGQVIGETDRLGAFPTTQAFSPQDVFATMYRFLGVDPSHEFHDLNGRPVPILYGGHPIAPLLS